MGQGTHAGHSAATRQRIDAAREHYEARAQRRPTQVWFSTEGRNILAAPKGEKGALPRREFAQ